MKITIPSTEINHHPLIGAEVVFTKHSEKNKKHIGAKQWLTLSKVYTVVNYSDYPEIGMGPQIICDNGADGDVPMDELDYDIISRHDTQPNKLAFSPVTITLESQDDVQFVRDAFGKCTGNMEVCDELNKLCGYSY